MSDIDVHKDLHSDQGGRKGEHPGRAANPIIKVHDIAWLEFEKPDLAGAEAFAQAFGFATALRTADELHLRGTDAGAPCVLIRRAIAPGSSAPPTPPLTSPTCCDSPRRPDTACGRCPRHWAASRSIWSIRAVSECGWSPAHHA
jgi:hypothetical protein